MILTQNSGEHTRELYDRYRFGTFSYGKREQHEPLLLELLGQASRGVTLFDIGCGTGYWLDTYVHAGIDKARIRCVDLAPANVEELRRRGFDAALDDVQRLHVGDNVSDLTVCIGVIHHADDPFLAFRELVRITRPSGRIYLNVYNRWHPYYYIVHRATFPLRYAYWHWDRRVADIAYWLARFAFQPLAYLALGQFLDERTGKTMFMDQVMTPRAHLFTKATVDRYARACGCSVEQYRYNRYGLMLSAAIRVPAVKTLGTGADPQEVTGA